MTTDLNIVGYEYHIDAGSAGKLHIVSENDLDVNAVRLIANAGKTIFYQYGQSCPICCFCLKSLEGLNLVDIEKTHGDIYLANPTQFAKVLATDNIHSCLFSHKLYIKIYKSFEKESVDLDKVILDTHLKDGLLLGIIKKD